MVRRTREGAERTRKAVLDAAVRVFLERGVARASLEEIARVASVTRGAVYWHFRDKLDLFLAIDACAYLPAEELLAKLAAYTGPDPLGELARALDEALADLEADADRRRLLTVVLVRCEYTEEMAPVLDRQRRADEALRTAFRRVFERASTLPAPHGLSPPWTPATAALALYALLIGMVHSWLRSDLEGGFSLAETGGEAVRAFLASVGAASSDERRTR
ncbi:TetR family transcriptional regulator [Roseomonas chloroacetimidivorans]|uniref:TetR family transcriptional regulator n=1 Tax=Roseomonas chloroacetimidivorans TaxID=1766656 RepID=UPI003C78E1CD